MKNIRASHKNDEGIALIVAMLFLVVMAILATSTASRVFNHTTSVDRFHEFQETYLGLTSAFDQAALGVNIGVPAGTDTAIAAIIDADGDVITAFNDAMDTFQAANPNAQLTNTPNVQYASVQVSTTNAGAGFDQIATYATARYVNNGAQSVQRTMLNVDRVPSGALPNINVWTNAIFAGVQQSGNVINGNVSVHGSVHILGEDAVLGDASVVLPDVMDLSGGAGIYNNYDGMDPDIERRLPSITGADGIDTLESNFRVKNGMVNINGNTSIGESTAAAGSKWTLDGVYVNNQWMGNATTLGEPNDGVVYSDNGYNQGYDLGNAISFPYFGEEVSEADNPNYGDGQVYFDGSDPTSYYMENQTPYQGDVTIVSNDPTTSFYYNSSTGNGTDAIIGSNPGTNGMPTKADVEAFAAAGEFVVWYDGTSGTMYVNGRVAVDGNISIESGNGANSRTVDYEGQGTLMAYDANGDTNGGDVSIDANFLTENYPLTNVVGIMAEGDFTLGATAGITMMGGFYAQGGVSINKQTNIIGTIVADYFDMGGQVPSIFYVPELGNAWTADSRMIGMGIVTAPPGAGPNAVWFEIGVPLS